MNRELEQIVAGIRSKHVAVPAFALSIACRLPVTLRMVPRIYDLEWLCHAARAIGDRADFDGNVLTYQPRDLRVNEILDLSSLDCQLRQSILLAPLVIHVAELILPLPSGDVIGVRPIDAYADILNIFAIRMHEGANALTFTHCRKRDTLSTKIALKVPSTGVTFVAIACIHNCGIAPFEVSNISTDPEIRETLEVLGADYEITQEGLIMRSPLMRVNDIEIPLDRIAISELLLAAALHGKSSCMEFVHEHLRHRMGKHFFPIINSLGTPGMFRGPTPIFAAQYPGLSTDILPALVVTMWILKHPFTAMDEIFEWRMTKLNKSMECVAGACFEPHTAGFNYRAVDEDVEGNSRQWDSDNIRQTSSGLIALSAPRPKVDKVVDATGSIWRAYTWEWFKAIEQIAGVRLYHEQHGCCHTWTRASCTLPRSSVSSGAICLNNKVKYSEQTNLSVGRYFEAGTRNRGLS